MSKSLLFLGIALCLSFFTLAQDSSSFQGQIGIKGGRGFIIAHNPTISYLTFQHISKLEVYSEKNTLGEKLWHQRYNYPRYGISLSYFDLNNDHFGSAVSILPYFKFSLFRNIKPFDLWFRGGIGLGYIENPFDPENNFKNIAIGSQLNVFFSFLLDAEFKVTERQSISLGANLSHFSNTAFAKPNLGINIPTVEVGLIQRLGNKTNRVIQEDSPFERPKVNWQLYYGVGWNEVSPNDPKKYIANAFSLRAERQYNHKSIIGLGPDFFYNPAQIGALELDSIYIDKGFENLQFGLSFHHILRFGRISNIVQIGYYLKTENEDEGNYYQIVGGKYHFSKSLKGLIALKTHLSKAEYLMFGFEYNLTKRNE